MRTPHSMLVSALALACAAFSSAHAETRGLVVGIDDYVSEFKLEGAVNDANDIVQALQRYGAKDIVNLLDRAASRARIEREWMALVARSRPGDTIVWTYAGHGGQEPDQQPYDEQDGLDEALLLAGFNADPSSSGFGERIVDDTIGVWFKAATSKGVRVIFVADACHSGTLTRSIASADARVTERGHYPPYGDGLAVGRASADAEARASAGLLQIEEAEDDKNLIFLSATLDSLRTPEVMISNAKRGALSYAFARAIDGDADENGDGTLQRFELQRYVNRQVKQLSNARQTPAYRPRGGADGPVLGNFAPLDLPVVVETPLTKLNVRVVELAADAAKAAISATPGAVLVGDKAPADLIWNARERRVASGLGDVVAYDISAGDLARVIDKWRVRPALKAMAVTRALDLKLSPNDNVHEIGGELLSIASAAISYPYVTVLDITPQGALELLYPINDKERQPSPVGRAFTLDGIEVRTPLGADDIMVIASKSPLTSLHEQIAAQTTRPLDLPKLLKSSLDGVAHQIGFQDLVTGPKGTKK